MYIALETITVMLAAVTMSLALAHALELPGKMRLTKEEYLAVQAIIQASPLVGSRVRKHHCRPRPVDPDPQELTTIMAGRGAAAALIAVQIIFWTMTQPVNKYWLQNTKLSRVATRFFERGSAAPVGDWTVMRDRWERSHVLRAIASVLALLLLISAVALSATPHGGGV